MSGRPLLGELGRRLGIAESYFPAGGGEPRWIEEATQVALAGALGYDAGSEDAAGRALQELEARERARGLPPCAVVSTGQRTLSLAANAGLAAGAKELAAELLEEGGERRGLLLRAEPSGHGEDGMRLWLELPEVQPGYHAIAVSAGGRELGRTTLLVAPERCVQPAERLGGRPGLGYWVNLYALRRERGGLGIGDFGALRELLAGVAAGGGDFVGLSPLHALAVRGGEVSPYSPQSRWFRSPLYLELEAVPELAECEEARALLGEGAAGELAELRAARWLDHERIERLQERLLEPLHRCFARRHGAGTTARGAAYASYCAEQGERLRGFARYRALARWLGERGCGPDWREWPTAYREPGGAAVAQFAREHAEAVEREQWLQFELDRQLAELAAGARAGGLRLGLYSDLALGSAPGSFDTWSDPQLFAAGVSVGAPADPLGPLGQDWSFPPMAPAVLAERGFADWAQLVRAGLRHAGALRIDHILGCMRQWWIPRGFPAARGAYLRYPLAELLAVLAIESRRSGALIIGEDLGTVPPGLEDELAARGVLSLRVLLFEREYEHSGGFRPAHHYSPRALVCANTHDLPTLAAFWTERDLLLRRELGLLEAGAWDHERAERERARAALLARLRADGLLPEHGEPELNELVRAAHRLLGRTPAPLLALALGDLAGEVEPVNLPGVPPAQYRSWSRRMDTALEPLAHGPAAAALAELAAERAPATPVDREARGAADVQ